MASSEIAIQQGTNARCDWNNEEDHPGKPRKAAGIVGGIDTTVVADSTDVIEGHNRHDPSWTADSANAEMKIRTSLSSGFVSETQNRFIPLRAEIKHRPIISQSNSTTCYAQHRGIFKAR